MIKKKLDYCVSLRVDGLSTNEIKNKMRERGFSQSEIEHYLKRSDEVYISKHLKKNPTKFDIYSKKGFKIVLLFSSLVLLSMAFFGYYFIGIIGLFMFWNLLRVTSFKY